MPQTYQTNGTINRTYCRPTRTALPLGIYDLQSLPPYGWCENCGKEIYQKGHTLCPSCHSEEGAARRIVGADALIGPPGNARR